MNDLKLPYCYKHLSLDYIMDNNNTHIYQSGHTPICYNLYCPTQVTNSRDVLCRGWETFIIVRYNTSVEGKDNWIKYTDLDILVAKFIYYPLYQLVINKKMID